LERRHERPAAWEHGDRRRGGPCGAGGDRLGAGRGRRRAAIPRRQLRPREARGLLPHRPPADGFRLDKGAYETIAFPGASNTVPFDLNDRGQVVGSYLDAAGAPHGFLLEDGVYTEIETPDFPRAHLLGINDSGRIVGGYVDDGGTVHGLMRDERGRFTTFDAPGATTATGAIDINDRRQIVGIVR
jgi:hypothetical protein